VLLSGPFAVWNSETNAQGWLECVQEGAQGYLPPPPLSRSPALPKAPTFSAVSYNSQNISELSMSSSVVNFREGMKSPVII